MKEFINLIKREHFEDYTNFGELYKQLGFINKDGNVDEVKINGNSSIWNKPLNL